MHQAFKEEWSFYVNKFMHILGMLISCVARSDSAKIVPPVMVQCVCVARWRTNPIMCRVLRCRLCHLLGWIGQRPGVCHVLLLHHLTSTFRCSLHCSSISPAPQRNWGLRCGVPWTGTQGAVDQAWIEHTYCSQSTWASASNIFVDDNQLFNYVWLSNSWIRILKMSIMKLQTIIRNIE